MMTTRYDALREYVHHKRDCVLSRAQVPSFGCMSPDYFKHFGGQCSEKRKMDGWECLWHCMKPAGHVGPHRGCTEKKSDPPNEWEAGDCTCGLSALLEVSQREEKEGDQARMDTTGEPITSRTAATNEANQP